MLRIDELLDAFLEMINEDEKGTGDFEILTNLKKEINKRLESTPILTYKDDILVITFL